MLTLYGINNCDTIKKARKYLQDNTIDYQFHDYKKLGVPKDELTKWIKQLGWEALINKRGTTWQKLEDNIKNTINESMAIQIMLDNPSIIKRPLLDINSQYHLGFKADIYTQLFS